MKHEIFCTLGPGSLNKKFLNFAEKNNVALVRLNLSHLTLKNLIKNIKFIQQNSKLKICIDTEGAQIRTKIKGSPISVKKNKFFFINKKKGKFKLYPENIFDQLKKNNILDIGFNNLKAKIIEKNKNKIKLRCIEQGVLENNKGVHVINNSRIKINYLTEKDLAAIEIGKKYKIKNFALSFTNSPEDIKKFKEKLKNCRTIFKLETKKAIKNLKILFKTADDFLIDRGDLSKEIKIVNVPIVQRKIFKLKNKFRNIKIAIATNFLESMIDKPFPTRAEVNDIYNACEMGVTGLVLAAETAIGKYPEECVKLLKKIIKVFNKNKIK